MHTGRSRIFQLLILCVIIVIAACVRFYKLGSIPPSLNADEVAIGYNAYSILKTGKDEYGKSFPLAFRSFDDYKTPLYVYLTVGSIVLFGLNDIAVRFPSALLGTLTVVGTYLLTGVILKRKIIQGIPYIPFISAFFLAISPWHIHFSRSAYEANVSVFFIVFGMYFLIYAIERGWLFIPSGIFLSLSLWSYHTPRIFVPLFLMGYLWMYRKEVFKQRAYLIISFCISAVLLIPLVKILISPVGQIRARGVSSLVNPAILDDSIQRIIIDEKFHIPFSAIIHNRRIEYGKKIFQGYISHFDPQFLFFEKAESKYRAPGMGLLYVWEIPLLCFGIYGLSRYKQNKIALIIWWILIAPIAASPTERLPHPVRTIVFLPMFQVLGAIGLLEYGKWIQQHTRSFRIVYWGGTIGIIILSTIYYFHQYFIHLPIEYAKDWQFGRKEVVEKVLKRKNMYDRIVVSMTIDQPQIFFLYYLRYDPLKYIQGGGTASGKFDTEDNKFDIYMFRTIGKYKKNQDEKVLYAGVSEEVIPGSNIIDTVSYPNGETAFVLFE